MIEQTLAYNEITVSTSGCHSTPNSGKVRLAWDIPHYGEIQISLSYKDWAVIVAVVDELQRFPE